MPAATKCPNCGHELFAPRLRVRNALLSAENIEHLIRDLEGQRAKVYEEGYNAGRSRAMRHMSDEPHLSLEMDNPYADGGPTTRHHHYPHPDCEQCQDQLAQEPTTQGERDKITARLESVTAAPQAVDESVDRVSKMVLLIEKPGRHTFYHGIGHFGYTHQVLGQDENGGTVFYDALVGYSENEIVVELRAEVVVTFPVRLVVTW